MPTEQRPTIREHLFWAYANLGMAEAAVHARVRRYDRVHYMIRAKLYRELLSGKASPASVMKDQRVRMKLPNECLYCGSVEGLGIDHVIAKSRGGGESGDNAVWACRSCNSSKSKRDLFEWWASSREGVPPLFVIRIYLKQAIAYFAAAEMLDRKVQDVGQSPFNLAAIPTEYPDLAGLIFSPWHARRPTGSA